MADIAEVVDLVLEGQHLKLRERCFVDKITTVFEESFGAFDLNGVKLLLRTRQAEVDAKLAEVGAAPPTFLSALQEYCSAAGSAAGSKSSSGAPPAFPSPCPSNSSLLAGSRIARNRTLNSARTRRPW